MITTEGPIGRSAQDSAEALPSIPVMTIQTWSVLRALLGQPQREQCPSEMASRLGMYPGTVSWILRRLDKLGWVARRQETAEEYQARPRQIRRGGKSKRFYRLTAGGAVRAREAVTREWSRFAPMAEQLRHARREPQGVAG